MKYSIIPLALLTVFTVSCKDDNPTLSKMIVEKMKHEAESSARYKANAVRASQNSVRASKQEERDKYEDAIRNGRTVRTTPVNNITVNGKIVDITTRTEDNRGKAFIIFRAGGNPSGEYLVKVLCHTDSKDVHVQAWFNNKEDVLPLNTGDTITISGNTNGIYTTTGYEDDVMVYQTAIDIEDCKINKNK